MSCRKTNAISTNSQMGRHRLSLYRMNGTSLPDLALYLPLPGRTRRTKAIIPVSRPRKSRMSFRMARIRMPGPQRNKVELVIVVWIRKSHCIKGTIEYLFGLDIWVLRIISKGKKCIRSKIMWNVILIVNPGLSAFPWLLISAQTVDCGHRIRIVNA